MCHKTRLQFMVAFKIKNTSIENFSLFLSLYLYIHIQYTYVHHDIYKECVADRAAPQIYYFSLFDHHTMKQYGDPHVIRYCILKTLWAQNTKPACVVTPFFASCRKNLVSSIVAEDTRQQSWHQTFWFLRQMRAMDCASLAGFQFISKSTNRDYMFTEGSEMREWFEIHPVVGIRTRRESANH